MIRFEPWFRLEPWVAELKSSGPKYVAVKYSNSSENSSYQKKKKKKFTINKKIKIKKSLIVSLSNRSLIVTFHSLVMFKLIETIDNAAKIKVH